MSKTVVNVLKFIAAAVVGYGIAYGWMIMRNETDLTILGGVGIATTVITFALLYMFGKAGGG